ncbi:hypothetical protein EDD85DRAFT_534751 [Armillaria nabsnona]|nr:hypothetical protein EDD85DRAFT_534751 [Armillaria nabsnona]
MRITHVHRSFDLALCCLIALARYDPPPSTLKSATAGNHPMQHSLTRVARLPRHPRFLQKTWKVIVECRCFD